MKNQFSRPPKRLGSTTFSSVMNVSTPASRSAAAAASTSRTYTAMWGMLPSVMGAGTGDWISSSVAPAKSTRHKSLSPSGVGITSFFCSVPPMRS